MSLAQGIATPRRNPPTTASRVPEPYLRMREKPNKQETRKSSEQYETPDVPNLRTDGRETEAESEHRSPITKVDGCEKARIFSYSELAIATGNFHDDAFLGEGRFGSVFRGKLITGEVVAVKRLNPFGLQDEEEFLAEVLMLSQLRHPNLVNIVGYCAEGTQRLLVLEFMPLGSLGRHLHDLPTDKKPLDWDTRMKIADGVSKGLDYLHSKAKPPVIFGDLKPSNILLDEGFHPKLSDFGFAKFGLVSDSFHVSTTDMGTWVYRAPEFVYTGKVTAKSDTYSFGVVLLEIISGRKAYDVTRGTGKTSLVEWWQARPRPETPRDRKRYLEFADPKLKDEFPQSDLCKILELAAMCISVNPDGRLSMHDVFIIMNIVLTEAKEKKQIGAGSSSNS